jgi:hypothetical protein
MAQQLEMNGKPEGVFQVFGLSARNDLLCETPIPEIAQKSDTHPKPEKLLTTTLKSITIEEVTIEIAPTPA